MRSLAQTLAAFLAVQAVWVAYAFLSLPPAVALDFLWPTYVLDTYAAWMEPSERWPLWTGWPMFIGQQLTPVVGAVLGLTAIAHLALWRGGSPREGEGRWSIELLPLLLPIVFYVLGCAGYFRHVYHFYQFAWALVIPVAWVIRPWPKSLPAIALLLLPGFALNAKVHFLNGTEPGFVPTELPGESSVWIPAQMETDLQILLGLSGEDTLRRSAFFALGGGMYHAYGFDIPVRQPWFLPGFVRPYDETEFLEVLPRLSALVIVLETAENREASGFCAILGRWNPLSPAACDVLEARLGPPERIGDTFVVFPVS